MPLRDVSDQRGGKSLDRSNRVLAATKAARFAMG